MPTERVLRIAKAPERSARLPLKVLLGLSVRGPGGFILMPLMRRIRDRWTPSSTTVIKACNAQDHRK